MGSSSSSGRKPRASIGSELATAIHHNTYVRDNSGAKYLGDGCFGSAYLLPCGRVLKVGDTVDGTALWLEHAARMFTATGRAPLYAPEVYEFGTTSCGGYWCVMEFVTTAMASTRGYLWDCAAPGRMQAHLEAWGDSIGLARHVGSYNYPDMHGNNWGHTKSGRSVTFDPFAGEQQHGLREVPPIPPKMRHRIVRHAGPSAGRWARG